jgi:Na+-driven multidrug efflux pump
MTQTTSKLYLWLAFLSSILFTFANSLKTVLTAKVGTDTILYCSPGVVIASIIYNIFFFHGLSKKGSIGAFKEEMRNKINLREILIFLGYVLI